MQFQPVILNTELYKVAISTIDLNFFIQDTWSVGSPSYWTLFVLSTTFLLFNKVIC